MTVPADLRKAEAAYRMASQRAETLCEIRNEIVRNALAQGMTHRQVANATGLSRGRISQIKDRLG